VNQSRSPNFARRCQPTKQCDCTAHASSMRSPAHSCERSLHAQARHAHNICTLRPGRGRTDSVLSMCYHKPSNKSNAGVKNDRSEHEFVLLESDFASNHPTSQQLTRAARCEKTSNRIIGHLNGSCIAWARMSPKPQPPARWGLNGKWLLARNAKPCHGDQMHLPQDFPDNQS